MGIYILASMFPNGFGKETTQQLQKQIKRRDAFAFVASEFEKDHEKTDGYFRMFLNMFREKGMGFAKARVIDGRIPKTEAQRLVREADVVWLSGGDTPAEFAYLKEYGLDTVIRQHAGVVIGLSAGAINLSKTAICTVACGHARQLLYPALGCVEFSVEPHFAVGEVSEELLALSAGRLIYGLCDDSMIVCENGTPRFVGEIYRIENGRVTPV